MFATIKSALSSACYAMRSVKPYYVSINTLKMLCAFFWVITQKKAHNIQNTAKA